MSSFLFQLTGTYIFNNPQIIMSTLYVAPDDDDEGYIIISEVSSKMLLQNSINCLYQLVFSTRIPKTSRINFLGHNIHFFHFVSWILCSLRKHVRLALSNSSQILTVMHLWTNIFNMWSECSLVLLQNLCSFHQTAEIWFGKDHSLYSWKVPSRNRNFLFVEKNIC